jgi:peptide-methionine (S)-S-oxide reductase
MVAECVGGRGATADYETVSSGRTGRAEPSRVTYGQILRVFFVMNDLPKLGQLKKQFPDLYDGK